MIPFGVSCNLTRVSADSQPDGVFGSSWRHNGINKWSPQCGDVFFISLCSAIKGKNWLSLQHPPNLEVCVVAAEQGEGETLQAGWSRRMKIDFFFFFALRSLYLWNCSPPQAQDYTHRSTEIFLRLQGLLKGPQEFPEEPAKIHSKAWRRDLYVSGKHCSYQSWKKMYSVCLDISMLVIKGDISCKFCKHNFYMCPKFKRPIKKTLLS